VVANAVVSGYLILSLTLAFVHIVKRKTQNTRILLIILDVVSHQQIKTCSVYSLILLLTIDSSSCVRQCWVF